MRQTVRVLTAAALALAITGCGSKSRVAEVMISRTVQPKTPLSEKYMQIAVLNANVEGSTDEFDQKKWSSMTADLLQYNLQQAQEKHNVPLKLVDREHVQLAMQEKDLSSAGVTNNADDMGAARIQGASAILTSKITIKIDKQTGKKRSVKAFNVFGGGGWGGGGGGGGADTEQVDEEARNITVQCQFQLKDPGSNDLVVGHTSKPAFDHNKTKSSGFFGSSKTEADMNPRDQVIGAMIEKSAQEFMAKFVPVEIETKVTVKSSGNKNSEEGVKELLGDNYEGALSAFKLAISEKDDDHLSLFGAGVCCEKLGKLDEARKHYRTALSIKPKEPEYEAAAARVSAGM